MCCESTIFFLPVRILVDKTYPPPLFYVLLLLEVGRWIYIAQKVLPFLQLCLLFVLSSHPITIHIIVSAL